MNGKRNSFIRLRLFGSRLALASLFATPYSAPSRASLDDGLSLSPTLSSHSRRERSAILRDSDDRIASGFEVPKELQERVGFWFDIYTRYGSNQHVIHHVRYPWIVYDVVDTTAILNGPGHRWTKHHAAERLVQRRHREILASLKKLGAMTSYTHLSRLEKKLVATLSSVPGKRRSVFREAHSMSRVQLGQRDFFKAGLASSRTYLPAIEKEFLSRGLPVELSRLPFVESSFNVNAESRVGASGIWQIMPATGKTYLTINAHIDERNSPLKASVAAAEILKKYHRILKAWPLAITAYNHGPTGIRRALKTAKVTDLVSLIQRYYGGSFKFASANFYSSFLAALHAEKYHQEIFLDMAGLNDTLPPEIRIVSLERALPPSQIVKRLQIQSEEFLRLNLDLKQALRDNKTLPKGLRIILPSSVKPSLDREFSGAKPTFKEAALIYRFKAPS
jgi:membrane-bound lytic murein transglycosylase D